MLRWTLLIALAPLLAAPFSAPPAMQPPDTAPLADAPAVAAAPDLPAEARPQPLKQRVTDLSKVTIIDDPAALEAAAPAGLLRNAGPGSHLLITNPDGTFRCTANWVFKDGSDKYYLGTAGHCLLYGDYDASTAAGYSISSVSVRVCISGCSGGTVPIGTYTTLGPVKYAVQAIGLNDIGNDFGIVSFKTGQSSIIRPELWFWGGPTGAFTTSMGTGRTLVHYGHGIGVGESIATAGRVATSAGGNAD